MANEDPALAGAAFDAAFLDRLPASVDPCGERGEFHTFAWDGTSDGGAIAADGSYTVSFEATQGKNKVTAAALTLGVVSSVTSGGSGLNLNVGGLGSFAMSDVKQIF